MSSCRVVSLPSVLPTFKVSFQCHIQGGHSIVAICCDFTCDVISQAAFTAENTLASSTCLYETHQGQLGCKVCVMHVHFGCVFVRGEREKERSHNLVTKTVSVKSPS